jgi:dTDP-3-amino-3,4,6-trideoxy-alpha-D-glucose transaminase
VSVAIGRSVDVTATQPLPASAPLPFVELDNADPALLAELTEVVADVARRAAFTLGDEVEAFEREFAAYCEAPEAVGVSSGTEALVLALRALGVGPGDEVVLPANSFIATAEAVTLAGARPRVIDVDPATGLLTPALVEDALSARTRCVIPVHLYGATADLEGIVAVARRAGVAVVEDACQAHGARIAGRRTGTVGDLGCFSFYPTKNLGGWGDGGAVVTRDAALAERVRLLRSHGEGAGQRHRHRMPGSTARLDGIQAAVLRVKLRRLEAANARRRSLAAELTERLAGLPLELPSVPPAGDHVFHLYVVRAAERDELRARLAADHVPTAIHYPVPIHRTEAYASLALGPGSLPTAERLAGEICSLPFWPAMDEAALERLSSAVAAAVLG